MSGWSIFCIIALVMGVIVSNLLLLKNTAKIKVSDEILKKITDNKAQEKLQSDNKKPIDN